MGKQRYKKIDYRGRYNKLQREKKSSLLQSDIISKFLRKEEKLFFNLTEKYWLIKYRQKEYILTANSIGRTGAH